MLEKVIEQLKKINKENVNLFFIIRNRTKKEDEVSIKYDVYKTNIKLNIAQELKKTVYTFLGNLIGSKTVNYREYKTKNLADKENIDTIGNDQIEYLEPIIKDLGKASLDSFNVDENDPKKIWTYVIKLGIEDTIFCFRKYSPSMVLERTSRLSIFYSHGAFDEFNKKILNLDKNLDCIIYKDQTYIFNTVNFEKIFSFMDLYKREIEQELGFLERTELIDDIDDFWRGCQTDPRKIKKLRRVLDEDRKFIEGLTPTKVKKIDKEYKLNLKFNKDGKITGDGKDNTYLWKILQVLDDDHVVSTYSEQKYIATKKKSV